MHLPQNRYSPAPPPSGPSANTRFSPAPPPSGPPANTRYSPAPLPGSNGQAHTRYASEPPNTLHRTSSLPFAPRTSSPLAFHTAQQPQEHSPLAPEIHAQQPIGHHASQSADSVPRPPFRNALGDLNEAERTGHNSELEASYRQVRYSASAKHSLFKPSARQERKIILHNISLQTRFRLHDLIHSPLRASFRQSVSNLSNSEQFGSVYGIASQPTNVRGSSLRHLALHIAFRTGDRPH